MGKVIYKPGMTVQVSPFEVDILEDDKFDIYSDKRATDKEDEKLAALVESMRKEGFKGSIWVEARPAVDEDTPGGLVIVGGRRRIRAARIVGLETINAFIIDHNLPTYAKIGAMLAENELVATDNPVNVARKLERFVSEFCEQYRPSEAEVGEIDETTGEMKFHNGWKPTRTQHRDAVDAAAGYVGLSRRRVNQLLEVLSKASSKVLKAIEAGKIAFDTVYTSGWLELPHDKQDARLEKALAAANAAGKDRVPRKAARDDNGPTPSQIMKSARHIYESEKAPAAVQGFLAWLLGDIDLDTAQESCKWLTKAIEWEPEAEGDEANEDEDE